MGSDLILNTGGGTFAAAKAYVGIPTGNAPDVVALGDLNGDSWLDVIGANSTRSNSNDAGLGVFMNTGSGTLKSEVSYVAGVGLVALVIADLDGDGHLDVAMPNGSSNGPSAGTVSVLRGSGTGALANRLTFPAGTNPWALGVGDFNCEGRPDLVVGNPGSNTLAVLTNTCQ